MSMTPAEDAEWEKMAQTMANEALPYRVKDREWETALLVARKVLKWVSDAKLVPIRDSLDASLRALRAGGFVVVRAKETDELVAALDAFGMGREFQTDSVALRRAKTALRAFRGSQRIV